MSSHDLTLDMTLKAIHTMDAGQHVELKFVVRPSGDCDRGEGQVMSILTTKRRRRPVADLPSAWLGAGMVIGCAVTLLIGWLVR